MQMAATTRAWTLGDLHALPDDGNKYEVVRGQLFVTPPPSTDHESILVRLTRIIDPYVVEHGLGLTFHARAALRFRGSEAEPDLMVRRVESPDQDWETAPPPLLVVEVLSSSTRRRDREQKREFYLDAGVAEYWIVNPDGRTITAVRPRQPDLIHREAARWWPADASAPLDVVLSAVFRP